jgi:molybdenum cofactor biosynthesis protein A
MGKLQFATLAFDTRPFVRCERCEAVKPWACTIWQWTLAPVSQSEYGMATTLATDRKCALRTCSNPAPPLNDVSTVTETVPRPKHFFPRFKNGHRIGQKRASHWIPAGLNVGRQETPQILNLTTLRHSYSWPQEAAPLCGTRSAASHRFFCIEPTQFPCPTTRPDVAWITGTLHVGCLVGSSLKRTGCGARRQVERLPRVALARRPQVLRCQMWFSAISLADLLRMGRLKGTLRAASVQAVSLRCVWPTADAPKMMTSGLMRHAGSVPERSKSRSLINSAAGAAIPTDDTSSVTPARPNQVTSPLTDSFGRAHTYLRISLTERCNLRCTYCMPEEGVPLAPKTRLLTADEIVRVTGLFVRHGVSKVRLTGGEPLVRPDVLDIAHRIGHMPGVDTLAMTTNALVLRRHLPALRDAGLTALNISLDTLVAPKFELITRRKGHHAVIEGLSAALDFKIPSVKLNVVVMKGFNDDELADFCELTQENAIDVRFIEYMPFDGNRWTDSKFVSYADMLRQIGQHFGALERAADAVNDTTKHYRIPGFKGRIGFITSMSDNFCGTCNRLRLTADGNIKACLFGNEEISVRDAMRGGASDEELTVLMAGAVHRKHFALGGNRDMYEIARSDNRSMIRIGG